MLFLILYCNVITIHILPLNMYVYAVYMYMQAVDRAGLSVVSSTLERISILDQSRCIVMYNAEYSLKNMDQLQCRVNSC